MRKFNTTGPCDPKKHYMIMREALVAEGLAKVDEGKYITIFAPRQAGKSTYFFLLMDRIKSQKKYAPVWLSFENLKTVSEDAFYEELHEDLNQKLKCNSSITDSRSLGRFFQTIKGQTKPIVLIIDEFEGIPEAVLSEFMHTFRKLYHQKEDNALHSLILVGVSSIAELILSSTSPFNIVDQLNLTYFNIDEVKGLIENYTSETGHEFEPEVIKAIYNNTNGQPGLVCGLCRHLVEEIVTDKAKPVSMADFYKTLRYYLTEKPDLNIMNIVQKARQKKDFMLKLLFSGKSIDFSIHDPAIAFLSAHGVVAKVENDVAVPVPLYAKALIRAFQPLINGEIDHYVSAKDTFSEYVTPAGLKIGAILEKFSNYVRRRGFKAFDTEQLKEAAWHYSLDGFMSFFIERLEGQTFIGVPTGRGRADILIVYKDKKYVIETKCFTDNYYYQKGKKQLAEYLKSEELSEGYYVVFSNKHTDNDELYFEEEVEGKKIYTYIVCTQFEQASRV